MRPKSVHLTPAEYAFFAAVNSITTKQLRSLVKEHGTDRILLRRLAARIRVAERENDPDDAN